MNLEHETHAAPTPATAEATWQENKRLLLAALVNAGARVARITYEGSNDEGGIESVNVKMSEGTTFDPATPVTVFVNEGEYVGDAWSTRVVPREVHLEDALRDFAEEAIGRYHPYYEDGNGGGGEVTFDCEAKTIHIEHNDYYTDSDHTETQL